MADWSQTWTFFDGEWREGNVPLWGARTHAIWLGSSVFDGARIFEGTAPDLDLHCARVNASAKTMFLKPIVSAEEWIGLTREGMKKFPAEHDALRAADVLGRAGRADGAAGRSGIDPLCAHALRRADAQARRLLGHAVAVQAPDHRMRAGRCQGRLPLSEQRPRHVRGEVARLRQLPRLRHAGQRRRACQLQRVHGKGRRGVHAGAERHLPQRHHPPARHQADARGRDIGGRKRAALCRLRGGRRNLRHRQRLQGAAGHPHRRARAAARPALPQGARALLGVRAWLHEDGSPVGTGVAVSDSARCGRCRRARRTMCCGAPMRPSRSAPRPNTNSTWPASRASCCDRARRSARSRRSRSG